MTNHVYRDTDEQIVNSFRRVHGNHDETHVYIVKNGSKKFTIMAVDVYPENHEPIASEVIAHEKRKDVAEDRAQDWMEAHPKGIAGNESSGGGILAKVMGAIMKVDEAGKDMATQQGDQS